MAGTLLRSDWQSAVEDELRKHARSLQQAAEQATQGVQSVFQQPAAVQGPDLQQIQQELQRHASQVAQPVVQFGQQAQPAVQQAQQGVVQFGQQAQPAVENVQQQLQDYANQVVQFGQPPPQRTAAVPEVVTAGAQPPTEPNALGPPSVAAAPVSAGPQGPLQDYARQAARALNIDPEIFVRQIQQESGFRTGARSGAGAQGIAQFMPATGAGVARQLGVSEQEFWASPELQLSGAARHMRDLLDANEGDYARALAAYNAGQGAVNKYGGVPPFEETQRYIRTILGGERPLAERLVEGGKAVVGTVRAALPHSEEPGSSTDAIGNKWKTSFDWKAIYTGDYRTGTPHRGIDLVPQKGGVGTPIEAFHPGTVSLIQRDSGGAGGLMVYVKDADGLTHAYMHLAGTAPGLKVGDTIARGQTIATMGESGTEGSPHLHYEVRRGLSGDPLDQLIDPRPYMAGQPGTPTARTAGQVAAGVPRTEPAPIGVERPAAKPPLIIGEEQPTVFGEQGRRPAFEVVQDVVGEARRAAEQAAERVIQAAQQIAPNLGFDEAELERRRRALETSPVIAARAAEQEAALGPVETRRQPGILDMPGAVLGGVGGPTTPGPVTGTQAQVRERINQEIEQHPAFQDWPVPVAAGVGIEATKMLLDPLTYATWGPLLRGGRVLGAGVEAAMPGGVLGGRVSGELLGKLTASGVANGLQNAMYEVQKPNPDPGQVGLQFAVGAIGGPALEVGAPALARVGRHIIQNADQLTPMLRGRQPAEAEVGFAMGMPTGGRAAEPPAAFTAPAAAAAPVPVPEPPARRMFHGTGAAFDRPEAGRFDPNGLYGPGYYMTTDPRVAGGEVIGPRRGKALETLEGGYAQSQLPAARRLIDEELENAAYYRDLAARPEQTAGWERLGPGEQATRIDEYQFRAREADRRAASMAETWTGPETTGPNVRAVDVPQNARLFDVEGVLAPEDARRIADNAAQYLGMHPNAARDVLGFAGMSGDEVYQGLVKIANNVGNNRGRAAVNELLAAAGFDGIRYSGGQRIPMADAAGRPIEHTATVIFPESLPKIRNAISGRQGGQARAPFALDIGGAAAGGYAGAVATPEEAPPEERLRNIGIGAGVGLLGGRLAARRLGPPGGLVPAEAGAFRAPTREAPALPRPGADILRATTTEPPTGPTPQEPRRLGEVVSNPYGLREARPGETPMTEDEMLAYAEELETRIEDVQARREAVEEMPLSSAELRAERVRLEREAQQITAAYDQMTSAPAGAQLVRSQITPEGELPFDRPGFREDTPEPVPVAEAMGGRDEGARLAQEVVLTKGRGRLRSTLGEVIGEREGVTGRAILAPERVAEVEAVPPSARTVGNMPNMDAMLGDDMPEIAAQIRKAAEDNPELFEKYRQGVITFDSLRNDLAARVGMTKEEWLKTPVGKGFNEREMMALQAAAIEAEGRLQDLGQTVVARGGVDNLSPEELAYSLKELVDTQHLLAVARGGRSTAGRTLNVLKQRFTRSLASSITAGAEAVAKRRDAASARRAAARATRLLTKTQELEVEAKTAVASAQRNGAPRNILQEIDQAYADLDRYNAMSLHEKGDEFKRLAKERAERAAARKARVRDAPEELLSALRAELKAEQKIFAGRKDTWETMAFWDAEADAIAAERRRGFRGGLYLEQQRKVAQIAAKQNEIDARRAFDAELRRRTNQSAKAEALLKSIGGVEASKDVLRNFLVALNDPDPMAAAKFIKGMSSQSNWVRANIVRVAGMLSAPITHMVNVGGSAGNAVVEATVRGMVVPIDAIRAGITGGERQAYKAELLPMMKAYGPGFLGSWGGAVKIMQTGVSPTDALNLSRIRPGFGSGSEVVDIAVEAPLRALTAEDHMFRAGAMAAQGQRVAMRQAIREGFRGEAAKGRAATIAANLEEYPELAQEAADAAARMIFQERRTVPGVGNIPIPGPTVEAAKLVTSQVVPFVRTPTNITAQGVGLSPLGFVGAYEAARGARAGARAGIGTAEHGRQVLLAEERVARAMLGSAVLGGGLALGAAGLLTAGYPEDQKTASTLPQGWRPWSMRLQDPISGNWMYIPFQNLAGIGVPMAMAAIITDPTHRGKSLLDAEEQLNAVASIGSYVLDNTFLQGLKDVVDMFSDPRQGAAKFAEPWVGSYGPYSSLFRDMQRTFGVAQRNPREGLIGLVDAFAANYPGLAGMVPEATTPLGEPRVQGATGLARQVPFRYDIERDEPTLLALRTAGVGIPREPKTLSVGRGYGVELTEPERDQLKRMRGAAIREEVARELAKPRVAGWQRTVQTADPASAAYKDALANYNASMQATVRNATADANLAFEKQLGRAEVQRRMKLTREVEPSYLGTPSAPAPAVGEPLGELVTR